MSAFAQASGPIVIGHHCELTGGFASWGYWHNKAALAATKVINDGGGIAGRKLELVTERPGQAARKQTLVVSAKEIDGKVHTLSRFLSPASVEGVSMLSVEGAQGGPEQIFLYLPKLKRVRRVARAQRGQSFMDTELSYADLGDPEATRKLAEGAVRIDGQKVQDRELRLAAGAEHILQLGPRRFARVKIGA